MNAETFKPGDIVMLKSGGPHMTVSWCQEEFGSVRAFCEWFDDKHALKSGKFAPASLELVKE